MNNNSVSSVARNLNYVSVYNELVCVKTKYISCARVCEYLVYACLEIWWKKKIILLDNKLRFNKDTVCIDTSRIYKNNKIKPGFLPTAAILRLIGN